MLSLRLKVYLYNCHGLNLDFLLQDKRLWILEPNCCIILKTVGTCEIKAWTTELGQ